MAASMRVRLLRNFCKLCNKHKVSNHYVNRIRCMSTAVAVDDSDIVEYPPIKPRFPPGNWGHLSEKKAWEYHEEIENLNKITDVRERLERWAEKEVSGYKVHPSSASLNALDYYQFITKTHMISGEPDVYDGIDVESEFQALKPLIINAILSHHTKHHCTYEVTHPHLAIGQYVSTLFSALAGKLDYLRRAQVDENVDVKSFWWRHGFDLEKPSPRQNKFGIITFQSQDVVDFQIRTELPLPEFIPTDAKPCLEGEFPDFPYSPLLCEAQGIKEKLVSVSGHWISDPCEFGHTSFHCDDWLMKALKRDVSEEIVRRAMIAAGIGKSFFSTLSQAYNQGFDMYRDITYPLTTQTVLTDGREFTFFSYQLNTIHLWLKEEHQPLRNVCWVSPKMALYETVENGEVHGFNDNVLKHLLKFMKLQPVDKGIDLRPHLTEEAPREKKIFINEKGTPALPHPVIGRWQYPRDAVYF